jgi:hypothetical protein
MLKEEIEDWCKDVDEVEAPNVNWVLRDLNFMYYAEAIILSTKDLLTPIVSILE